MLLAAAALALTTTAAEAATLHVAPHGSDRAPGTAAAPLASCAAAVAKLGALAAGGGPATEVQFAPGTYPLTGNTSCGSVRWNGSAARGRPCASRS